MDWKATDNNSENSRFIVAGRGFAGLAITYFLKKRFPGSHVLLYDPNPLGASASGAASGLLEPIGGRLAIRSYRAEEGMAATKELLDVVSAHLGEKVYQAGGILHPPMTLDQKQLYEKKVQEHPERYAFDEEGAFLVKEGINVFSRLYLEGLFSLVQSMGVEFVAEKAPLDDDEAKIFLAIGVGIDALFPGQFRLTRGQAMQVRKGRTTFRLPKVHKGYVALDADPAIYHIGSTFERGTAPLMEAPPALCERNKEIFPELPELEVLHVRSGTRVYADEKNIPKIIPKKNFLALTGLGSKGLLYHALYAKELVEYYTKL